MVARELGQTPVAEQIDAAVARPQAAATVSRSQKRRNGRSDERYIAPPRFGSKAAIDFVQPVHRTADPPLEFVRDRKIREPLNRKTTGKLAQCMTAHSVGDGPNCVIGLIQIGILIDSANPARVGP